MTCVKTQLAQHGTNTSTALSANCTVGAYLSKVYHLTRQQHAEVVSMSNCDNTTINCFYKELFVH